MILEEFIVDYLHLVSYNIIIKNITYYNNKGAVKCTIERMNKFVKRWQRG